MARYRFKFKNRAVARLLPPEIAAFERGVREIGIGAGVQNALSAKEDPGFAAEYLYADGSSDPSALICGR